MDVDSDAPGWRKASYSNASYSCVEVGRAAGGVLVRDTKDTGRGPILKIAPRAWRTFTATLKQGALM